MNILIIEDDLTLAYNLKKTFQKHNFANLIKVLNNLEEFLHNSCVKYFDIVLVDICLWKNNTDGLEILQHIRKNNLDIPVIVITSIHDYECIEDTFRRGAHDYIIKPFRSRELQIRIKRWFRNYIFFEYYSIKNDIKYSDLRYNLDSCEFSLGEKKISMSKSSKYILLILLTHKEKLVSKDYLSGKIWWECKNSQNLRIKILRLKQDLNTVQIGGWIQTIRWEWYILQDTWAL